MSSTTRSPREGGKPAYRTPKLRSYGDIRQITQGASNDGRRDSNANGPRPRKTTV
jgi:hypothetical protein